MRLSVPVPIPDENKRADIYSLVQIRKPYITAGAEYYIELRMTEMAMCKTIRFIFYCEELLVVKHKSAHNCSSAIYYDLGPKVITRNCVFNYKFDAVIPPCTILDGGKNLLLANFHGPRSLKCDSNDGGLAKPAPEHTYAVVPRDFLCDCQLDLEYASVLKQISSCSDKRNSKMVVYFTVNLAFWQYLHNFQPKLAHKIKLSLKKTPQEFAVRLYNDDKDPLQVPSELTDIVAHLDQNDRKSKPEEFQMRPIFTRTQNNILLIGCTALVVVILMCIIGIIVKHFRLQTLVTSLGLTSLVPVTKAYIIQKANEHTITEMPMYLAKQHAEKVVCSHPTLTAVGSVIAITGLLYGLFKIFKSLSWYRGYKHSRCCTIYFFLYHEDYYTPLQLRKCSGHMSMFTMENKMAMNNLKLTKNYLWDLIEIDWADVKIKNLEPISLPNKITVPLNHKVKTRNVMSKPFEIPVTVKSQNP